VCPGLRHCAAPAQPSAPLLPVLQGQPWNPPTHCKQTSATPVLLPGTRAGLFCHQPRCCAWLLVAGRPDTLPSPPHPPAPWRGRAARRCWPCPRAAPGAAAPAPHYSSWGCCWGTPAQASCPAGSAAAAAAAAAVAAAVAAAGRLLAWARLGAGRRARHHS
jgi:hypothetical protein